MKVLILKLEGPMASFGDVAVDEVRPTATHPFKSMIVGLIGNALGYKRTEGERLESLQDAIRVASRIDRAGGVMTDYQTALTNDQNPLRPTFIGKDVWTSRPVNLRTRNNDKNAIQIWRDYLVDASVTVAVSCDDESFLEFIAAKVKKPERPLFLGRKACPPTRPIFEGMVDAATLVEALRHAPHTEGRAGSYPVRTEASEKGDMKGHWREFLVRDLKNWKNSFHAAERPVVEGLVEIGA